MVRKGVIGQTLGVAAMLAALACGGSDRDVQRAGEGDPQAGEATGTESAELDAECCCQRYDEDGNPTGAVISNQTACKSTGGTCTQDQTQCQNE
jgi:hypothetical protein